MNHGARPPLHLVIELVRAAEVANRHGVAGGEWNRYLLREPDGGGSYEEGEFAWKESMQADLSATADLASASTAVERLAEAMRAFVDTAGWARIARRIQEARAQGQAVALTVRSAAHELSTLPWEHLAIGDVPLYQTADCLLRYESPGPAAEARPEARRDPPAESGRLLMAWAGAVPAAEHLQAIATAARAGYVAFDPVRDQVANASRADLERELLASRPPVTILHLVCHGRALPGGQGYGLMLEGASQPVSPDEIRALVAPHRDTLRLVVLAACMGSNPGAMDNQLGSVAQAIHEAGVPAVIASRYPLTTAGSTRLTAVLYQRLLVELCSLEDAFLAARVALQARERGPEEARDLDGAALQLYGRASLGLDFRPWIFRPYRGLAAYGREHERFFFGREEERKLLCRRMVETMERGEPRFLLIAGASGTGKSSLVKAGLVSDLEAGRLGEGSPPWKTHVMRPSSGGLATDRLIESVDALRRAANAAAGERPRCALVVDQLEEVFTAIADPEQREGFLRMLWHFAGDPGSGVFVLATMRIEYLGELGRVRMDKTGALFDRELLKSERSYLVPQLGAETYERIIRGPAEATGVHMEPGLLHRLVDALRAEPGALPLLSFALDQLWEKRAFATQEIAWPGAGRAGKQTGPSADLVAMTGWWLTDAAYQALGGIEGALARTADGLLQQLGPAHRDELCRVLVQLVHGHEDPMLATRRRGWRLAMQPDAAAAPSAARIYNEVLDRFVNARLLVQGSAEVPGAADAGPWIELAHDALIRYWPALHTWYREARFWLAHTDELRGMAEAWRPHRGREQGDETGEREKPYLLRGERLIYQREMWRRHGHHLGAQDRALIDAFLTASAAAEHTDKEAQQSRLRVTVLSAVAAAALVGALGMYALTQRSEGEAQQSDGAAQRSGETKPQQAPDGALIAGARELMDKHQYAWATKLLAQVQKPDDAGEWAALAYRAAAEAPATTLHGHTEEVRMAVFSPDGTRVVSASGDQTARIWRADGTGEPVVLQGHAGEVRSAAFSPDGAHVVTASADKTARIWRAGGKGEPVILKGHTGEVTFAAFSPDGAQVVTASADKTARIWRAGGKGEPVILQGYEDKVLTAAFSPDGTQVVTASPDGTARIWRTDGSGEPVVLRGHKGAVLAAAFRGDGQYVVTASLDKTARIWRADGAGEPVMLRGHEDLVQTAAFSADGKYVVTASLDKTARIWRADGGVVSVLAHEDIVLSAAFSADGKRVVTASRDGAVRIWRADEWHRPVVLAGQEDMIHTAVLSADRRFLVTAYNDTTVRLWRTEEEGPPVVLKGHEDRVWFGVFSPDSKYVVTASRDGTARIWRTEGGSEVAVLPGHEGGVWFAAFSPDGKHVLTSAFSLVEKAIRIWRADGKGPPVLLPGTKYQDRRGPFSPDSQYVVTASKQRAQIWRIDGEGEPLTLEGPEGDLAYARFSPDGKHVLTTSTNDKTVRIWRADGGGEPLMLRGHEEQVTAIDCSPDSRYVVTASWDKTARIWRMDGKGEPVVLRGHEDQVTNPAFSPDNRYILTSSKDGTVRIWRADGRGEPVVLREPALLMRSGELTPDGKYVVTIAVDRANRVWLRRWPTMDGLLSRLASANTDCLPPDLREKYFLESADKARHAYESCERAFGRTPLYQP